MKKPKYQDIIEAIGAANLAPLAGNIPTLKFIIVQDKKKIEQLAEAAQQGFVGNVSYIIVVTSIPTECERSYGTRAKKYCPQQAGAAIENLLLKTTDLGLATTWVGAFSDTTVKNILKIPDNIIVEGMFPIGYPVRKEKQKKKINLDQCLYFDKWKNEFMTPRKRPEPM